LTLSENTGEGGGSQHHITGLWDRLLYAGENDALMYGGTKECSDHIANATFVSLPGLDHNQVVRRPNVILPHIKKFLAEVTASERRTAKHGNAV
jgi:hypothetical protein